jgi:O-methyltransferase involved in polyketide biosynthesis
VTGDGGQQRVRVTLGGVPETLLWNLYHRALAASGPHPLLADPKAVELVERIDYPFDRLAQRGDRAGQWHGLRVRRFDGQVRRFLAEHPDGTVVALGEGLETQFWRVDNGSARWLTVDLPETVEVRRALLPDGPRQRTVACPATDERWAAEVDASRGVLVTAQGLLMYLQAAEVDGLVELCARRFPGGALLFDAVPRWMITSRGRWLEQDADRYRPPPWTWGMDAAEQRRLAARPGVTALRVVRPARGRGLLFGVLLPALERVPALRYRLPTFPVLLARLG